MVTTYQPKGIKPNIWVILIGPSRIVRKTTSLNLGEDIIREVDEKVLMPASFSPEGLYDILNNMKRGDIGVWIKDEMGGFFRDLQKKRYMSGAREILSMIYTGRGEERKLRSYHFKIPWGIYVTSAGTVPTPASYYFSEEDFTSGFLNRYILSYALSRDKRIPLLHNDPAVQKMRENIISEYKELVNECVSKAPLIVSFSSKAIRGLEDYDGWVECEIQRLERENPSTLWKLYLAESPNQLMKLTVLRRLSRGKLTTSIIVVDEQDFIKAYNDLMVFLNCAREIIQEVQVSARPKQVETEERRLMRVYEIIKSSSIKGVKWTELLNKTFLLKADLINIIETLMEQERVIAVRGESSLRGGRRAIIFFTKENALASGFVTSGKILSPSDVKALLK
ncbi:MAG: hypothetical protein QW764_02945 [Desulfurococcaceae archaeon]